jgi:hypothetical protein
MDLPSERSPLGARFFGQKAELIPWRASLTGHDIQPISRRRMPELHGHTISPSMMLLNEMLFMGSAKHREAASKVERHQWHQQQWGRYHQSSYCLV